MSCPKRITVLTVKGVLPVDLQALQLDHVAQRAVERGLLKMASAADQQKSSRCNCEQEGTICAMQSIMDVPEKCSSLRGRAALHVREAKVAFLLVLP